MQLLRMRSLYHRIVAITLAGCALVACAKPTAVQRALSALHQRDDARALSLLRARIAEDPNDLAARRLLLRVLASTSDVPAALREIDALAARLPPQDPSALLERGHVLELAHRFDEALDAYDAAASLAPADPRGPREGGIRAAHWGEAEEALPRLEEAHRRGADDADLWHALGAVRTKLGDRAGALDAYAQVSRVAPARIEGHLGRASVGLASGDHALALREYEILCAMRPRDATFALARAYNLARLGRRQEAAAALDKASELGASPTHVAKIRSLL